MVPKTAPIMMINPVQKARMAQNGRYSRDSHSSSMALRSWGRIRARPLRRMEPISGWSLREAMRRSME
jgi:nuclear transport factor 2 (NTF2) superfamily protein